MVDALATSVASSIVLNWVLRFGVPDNLHTDQGTSFCNELMIELGQLLGFDKSRTSAYHPQCNGISERHNRVLADMLSKYVGDEPNEWDQYLPYLTFVYNTTVHRTTKATPFSLVFGQECQYPIDLMYSKPLDADMPTADFVVDLGEKFRESHMVALEYLGKAQQRQKDSYHKKVYGKTYKAGDLVWLFAPHLCKGRKFKLPWAGPYVIIEKISELNYKIRLKSPPKNNRVAQWQIVHYNRLKPYSVEKMEERLNAPVTRSKSLFVEDSDSEDDDDYHLTGSNRVELEDLDNTHGRTESREGVNRLPDTLITDSMISRDGFVTHVPTPVITPVTRNSPARSAPNLPTPLRREKSVPNSPSETSQSEETDSEDVAISGEDQLVTSTPVVIPTIDAHEQTSHNVPEQVVKNVPIHDIDEPRRSQRTRPPVHRYGIDT